MMNISACILSYNRADYLCEAIESVLKQTYLPTEILIFDNGSDQVVFDRVRPFLSLGVVWVGSDINHSAMWNFRRAVMTAKADFLFVLHDDDRLCPEFIEKQFNFLKSNPEIGAVTCNGYLINNLGQRNGKLLRQDVNPDGLEIYKTSAEVAIRYASDSCLPFSPVVYRSKFIRTVKPREEFGKVVDAVLFCELANLASLAYQLHPLYECRTHESQDSHFFPVAELNKLTAYFETETTGVPAVRKELKQLLVRQHTSRQLLRIFMSLSFPFKSKQFFSEIIATRHTKFKIRIALKLFLYYLFKKFLSRFYEYKSYRY